MSVLEDRDRDRGCFMRSAALTTASLPGSRLLSWEVEPSLPIYCCSSLTVGWGAFWVLSGMWTWVRRDRDLSMGELRKLCQGGYCLGSGLCNPYSSLSHYVALASLELIM